MTKDKIKAEKQEENKEKSKKQSNKHEIKVVMDGEKWQNVLNKTLAKKIKNAQIDGFRKGKVPKEIYLKKYGMESIFLDAADLILQEAYGKALDDSKLNPILQPSVDLEEVNEKEVIFKFTIITKPVVNIKKYKELKIEKEKVEISKEEIDDEIEKLLEDYTEVATKNGKIENKDIAIIDYEGTKDGKAFEGGKAENYSLEIGSNSFIPGFEEGLIGLTAGDEKDLELTFPEDYHEESLKGAAVIFHVKINEVKEKIKRTLDEEFFEDLALEGVKNEQELRADIEKNLKEHKENQAEKKYVDAILEAIAKNTEVDIPEELVEQEIDYIIKSTEDNLKMNYGIKLTQFFDAMGITLEKYRSMKEPEAYNNILNQLIVEKLLEEEKIEVTDEEVTKELEELSNKYNISTEEIEKEIGGKNVMNYEIKVKKLFEKLKEYNK